MFFPLLFSAAFALSALDAAATPAAATVGQPQPRLNSNGPPCSGDVVITQYYDTYSHFYNGENARYDHNAGNSGSHKLSVPASSAICVGRFGWSYYGGAGIATLGENSFIWSDYMAVHCSIGDMVLGDNSRLTLAVSAGLFQTCYTDAPEFYAISWTDVANVHIGSHSSVSLGWAAVVVLNGDLTVRDDCTVEFGNSTMSNVYHSGRATFESNSSFTSHENSIFTIEAGASLTVGSSASIVIGRLSQVLILNGIACSATGDVRVPNLTVQVWDQGFFASGISCVPADSIDGQALPNIAGENPTLKAKVSVGDDQPGGDPSKEDQQPK